MIDENCDLKVDFRIGGNDPCLSFRTSCEDDEIDLVEYYEETPTEGQVHEWIRQLSYCIVLLTQRKT